MTSLPPRFEFLDHPADVGFIARGPTLEDCFGAAAEALNEFGWETATVEPREATGIRARAATLEDLLFSWLSEILYLNDGEQRLFRRFEVAGVEKRGEDQWEIEATGYGEKFEEARHRARTYVKAVTYHQLSIQQTAAGWEATVYIDV